MIESAATNFVDKRLSEFLRTAILQIKQEVLYCQIRMEDQGGLQGSAELQLRTQD